MHDNDIDSIDKKINQSANDDLNGLESSLNHVEFMEREELHDKARDMLDDCSRYELKKVLKLLIKIARKSFEDNTWLKEITLIQ